ncbi:metallophosphoesterase [Deinococcus irradiatisoli]|uniref:Metallophosphoesterase n=1 Tax=Deinococcus irradiatisoli TaxID=2202254 RepID=A0A2Z3JHA1_9DEIO|nr:metallophosphoesterase [Deinococcus irradiatisoli]AWN24382.1 metallophosphoesterase [Deinococcus irradiatisoli]
MRKFIVIGDVHADYPTMWAALRSASCVDAQGQPTPPLLQGLFQVVFIGDLVHPKSVSDYARLIGSSDFEPNNTDHLFAAARAQVRELEKLQAFQAQAPQAVHFILGNHDDGVLHHRYVLSTAGGLTHNEFDPERGGVLLPDHLRHWFEGFARELRIGRVQFAHVGPLPAFAYYDDLFYTDSAPKRWWKETPEYVMMADLAYGVYGHTQMHGGIYLDEAARFAMIDALPDREYLELLIDPARHDPLLSVRAVPF